MSVPKTVEAIAIDKQGDLDVIELKTLPFEQGPKDFVVKVSCEFVWLALVELSCSCLCYRR